MEGQQQVHEDVKLYRYRQPSESSVLSSGTVKPVFLPGMNGIPVRGFRDPNEVTPAMQQKLAVTSDVHVRVFDLEDADDKAAYERLMSAAITLGPHVQVIRKDPAKDQGPGNWKIMVEWLERYYEPRFYKGVMHSDGNPLGV